jgi:serine/threonine-protein kinase RIO1
VTVFLIKVFVGEDYNISYKAEKGSQVIPEARIRGLLYNEKEKNREKDRSDRATEQQVLDRRTYLVLLKFFKGALLKEVNDCVSTGKEVFFFFFFNFLKMF